MEAVEVSTVMEDLLPVPAPELPPDRFLDRELSWLAFNNRVLDLAKDAKRVPLLERAKFLAIFSSNLDEFYMVRVAGLKRRIAAGVAVPTVSGMMPREVHSAILNRTRELVTEQAQVFQEDVRPALAKEGIEILRWDELTSAEKDRMDELFAERIFPVLTPLAVDPSHPFPYISGLSINLAVLVRNPETGIRQFARVKVPTMLSRFIPLAEGRYVALEDVIAHHLDQLFSGMQVVGHHTFRVTRNEDVEVEEDDAENLLLALEKELLRRKVGRPPVRLEVEDDMDPKMLELLMSELDISAEGGLPSARTARPARPVLLGRHRSGRAQIPRLSSLTPIPTSPRSKRRSLPTCSPPSSSAMCCCTTRTTRSRRACSASLSRRPMIRTSWRSSRPSTAHPATHPSSTP